MIRRMHGGLLLMAAVGLTTQVWSAASSAHQGAQPDEKQEGGQGSPKESSGSGVSECSPAQVAGILNALNKSAIDSAKLALSKSQNDEVREFAEKAIDAHTKLEKKLTDSLDAAGITPIDSDIAYELTTGAKREMDALRSSDQFDRDYAAHEVLAHAKAIGLIDALATGHESGAAGKAGEPGNTGSMGTPGPNAAPGSTATPPGATATPSETPKTPDALPSIIAKAREMIRHHAKEAFELESEVVGACGTPPQPTVMQPQPQPQLRQH
jgi:predicted outer membrane protein